MQLATSMLALVVAALHVPELAATALTRSKSVSDVRMDATPLTKVIEMLLKMEDRGIKEIKAEQVEFAKYKEWCGTTKDATSESIRKKDAEIVQLKADIEKASADAEELAQQIAEIEDSANTTQMEAREATQVRMKERADYKATHADLTESVEAVERTIQVLKEAKPEQKDASLVRIQASSQALPARVTEAIESFVATQQTPEAEAYEYQSTGVVDMLERLMGKFQEEREKLEKEELEAKHSYGLLIAQFSNDVKRAKAEVDDKTELRAKRVADAAEAKGDLEATSTSKAEEEKYLKKTVAGCELTAKEVERNQAVREEEVEALRKAVKLLRSDIVSKTAETQMAALVQKSAQHSRTALVQLLAEGADVESRRAHVADMLRAAAQQSGSKYLALIAERAVSDPFGKVKKMIAELISKLQEEANAEADQHAHCQAEMAANKATREAKASEVEELSSQLDGVMAKIAQLANSLKELEEEIAATKEQRAEAAQDRTEQKTANEQTIKEAQEAQLAVRRAHKLLQDYYAKHSDGAESLLQSDMADDLKSSAPYRGMQDEGGGVLDFLEVVMSDFARLEADTCSEEEAAEADFENFTHESEKSVAVKQKEVELKSESKQKNEQRARSLEKETKLTKEELAAANEYFESLKPECIDTGVSYEERVAMRQSEITSLQEAMEVLDSQA